MNAIRVSVPLLLCVLLSSQLLQAAPPGAPLMHLDAGGAGVVTSGVNDVTHWHDEIGTFTSEANGGGATASSFAFPAGTLPTVELDGGHFANNAGFAYDNDALVSFTTNDDLAIFCVVVPDDQASRLLVTDFSGGTGFGFGISDPNFNSFKFWTGPSLETGLADYVPGEPITVAAIWDGLGDGDGDKSTYVNGAQIAAHTVGTPLHTNPQFRVGSGAGLVQDWDGHIAEVLIYASADETLRTDVEAYFNQKYFVLAVPGSPLMHLDAGGAGLVESGGTVTDWNDETGTFNSGGSNGGGATLSSFDFPNGTFPTVDLDGGHYANAAGFQYDNDQLFEFDENSDLAMYAVIVPRSHQSSQIVSTFTGGQAFGFGVSDGVLNSLKFWTNGTNLESGTSDYNADVPSVVGATWEGLGAGNGGAKAVWVDGLPVATQNAPNVSYTPDLRVGSGGGLVQDFNGAFAEVLVYTDASEAQRLAVENYFSSKYGLLPDIFKVLHLDAANGTPTAWDDELGNHQTEVLVGNPTVGTHDFPTGTWPVMEFDGASGFGLNNDSALYLTDQFVIHAVIVPNGGNISQIILANYHNVCGFGFGYSDGVVNSLKHFTAPPAHELNSGGADTQGGIHAIVTAAYANGVKTTLVNGMVVATAESAINYDCVSVLNVATLLDGAGQGFNGDIAEICVWNGVNGETVDDQINAFKGKYGVAIGGVLCSELPAPPAGSLARWCAGGDGVSASGDVVTAWNDENGTFASEGIGGGGDLTLAAAGFPAGSRRVVNFPGNAGIKMDNDQAAELTVMTISAVIIHAAGAGQQIINTYDAGCGYGLGISDGRIHDIKHFTGGVGGVESLESVDGEEDVPAGVPSHVLATFDDRAGFLEKTYFVNGVLKGASSPSGGTYDYGCGVDDRLEIGMLFGTGAQFFNGAMAEILIYPDTSPELTAELNAYVEAAYGIVHDTGVPLDDVIAHWAADAGVTTDGGGVLTLADLSPDGANLATYNPTFGAGNQPQLGSATFPSGDLPVIEFADGGLGIDNPADLSVEDITIITVVEVSDTAGTILSNYSNAINWGYGMVWRITGHSEAAPAGDATNIFTSGGTCGTISDAHSPRQSLPFGWHVLSCTISNATGDKAVFVDGNEVWRVGLGNSDPSNPCPGIDGSEFETLWGFHGSEVPAIGTFREFPPNRSHIGGMAELIVLRGAEDAARVATENALAAKYFSVATITAATFFGADDAGLVNNGKRWNTVTPHPAWELYIGAGPGSGAATATSFLNNNLDCSVNIGLAEGVNTFFFSVAGFGLDYNGMNLWFNGNDLGNTDDGVSEPPNISVYGPNNGGPGTHLPDSLETMGFPLAGIAGAGTLLYSDPSGLNIRLADWWVDGAVDPGGEGDAFDVATGAGGQLCGAPNPDGIPDLVGTMILDVSFGPPTVIVNVGDSINDAFGAAEPGATVELKAGTHQGGRWLANKDLNIVGVGGDGGAAGGSMVLVEWPSTQDWEATVQPGTAMLYENATTTVSGIHFRIDVSDASPSSAGGLQMAKFSGPAAGANNVTFNNCIFEYVGTAPADVNVFNRNQMRHEGPTTTTYNGCEMRWSNDPVAFPSFVNNVAYFVPGGATLTINLNDCILDNTTDTNGKMRSIGSGGGGGGNVNVNLDNCIFAEDEHGGATHQQAWISTATATTHVQANFCDFQSGADRFIGHEGNPNVTTSLNGCIFFPGGEAFLPDPNAVNNIQAENTVFLEAGNRFRSGVFCCENENRAYVFRNCTFQDNDDQLVYSAPNFAEATEFSNCLFNMPNSAVIMNVFGATGNAPIGGNNMSNGGGGASTEAGGDGMGEATPGLTIVSDLLLDADGYHLTLCSPALGGIAPPAGSPNTADASLALWLKADDLSGGLGDRVNLWTDASAHGTTLEPRPLNTGFDVGDGTTDPEEAPILKDGGLPSGILVPSFDRDGDPNVPGSTNRLFQTSNLGAGDPTNIGDGSGLTLILFYRPLLTTSGGLGVQSVAAKRGSGSSVFSYQIENRAGQAGPLGSPIYVSYGGPTVWYGPDALTEAVWHVSALTISEDGAADTLTWWDSDSEDTVQTLTSTGTVGGSLVEPRNASTPEPFALGAHSQACCGLGETFAGQIAEVILYNRTLDATELNAVSGYLGNKYFGGASGAPPATANDVDGEARGSVADIGADELAGDAAASVASISVSGGGSGIQDAIDAAGACTTEIVVEDSLDYDPVVLTKTLTVRAAAGQTPRVVSRDGHSGIALVVADGGRNGAWDGIDVVQETDSGFGGDPGHNVLFLANGGDAGTVFNLSNTTVEVIDNSGIGSVDGRVAGFGDNVSATNCTFRRADANGNPAAMLFDQSGGSTFTDCQFGPTVDGGNMIVVIFPAGQQDGDTATFNGCTMSGYPQRAFFTGDSPKDVILNDCVVDGRLSFEGDARAIGGSMTANRCIIGGGDGEVIFAGDNSGKSFDFTNCILLGGNNDQFAFSGSNGGPNRGNHSWSLTNCTVVPSAAFPRDNFRFLFVEGDNATNLVQAATEVTLDNNIFANPGKNIAAVFDAGVATAPVVTAGTNLWDGNVAAEDAGSGAGGTDLQGSAGLDANGRLTANSAAAINAATDVGLTVDVDNDARPSATTGCPPNEAAASDLGADEYQADDVVCDDEDPVITCSGDVSVGGCDENSQAVVSFDLPTATDNLSASGDIAISCSPMPGSVFDEGKTRVICTATDEAGNSAECRFTVTVSCGGLQRPGDMNQDGANDQTDQLSLLENLFLGEGAQPCSTVAANTALLDANGDNQIDQSDAVYNLITIFLGGAPHVLGTDCLAIVDCPDGCPQ